MTGTREMHPGATPSPESHERKGLGMAACLLLPSPSLLPLLTSFCSLGLGSAYCERILSHHPKPRTYSPAWAPAPWAPCAPVSVSGQCLLSLSLQSPAWAWHTAAAQQMWWSHPERREALLASGRGWMRAEAWEGASAWLLECQPGYSR